MPSPSTTDLVPFNQIAESVVVLKDGSLRAVIEVSAINFDLRSSEEQSAILTQFQSFLNSIDFAVQVVVHSRRFDISSYVAGIATSSEALGNDLLKVQAQEYTRFVKELSELSNIMSKKFYVVLPFRTQSVAQASAGIIGGFKDLFKKKAPAQTALTPEQLATYQVQLAQRADLILGGLSGMGLKGHLLREDELIRLFTDLYNPVVPAAKAQAS